ncbi:class II aldolase/adducin family protein [Corticibacterium sp. UT-5YL-CI-8]|nr:class II aldolase/adducin family protein [Tianweitania sp. UT-5YL-CI-8]
MTQANEAQLRDGIVDTCRKMNASGINQGTAGNVSVRFGDRILITPTSVPYDVMTSADIIELEFDGTYDGRHRPSSEWRFHRDILRSRPEVDSVVHCHSVYATTLACLSKPIPCFHYMVAVAGGVDIRCADYATYGTQELSTNALAALEDRRACLLAHHGQIAIGQTLERALWLAIEVETLARLYYQILTVQDAVLIPEPEMQRVLEQMRRKRYGQSPDLDGVAELAKKRAS